MIGLSSRVKVPKVLVVLHWPTPGCVECAGETEEVAHRMYMCLSCRHVDSGINKTIQGKVVVGE